MPVTAAQLKHTTKFIETLALESKALTLCLQVADMPAYMQRDSKSKKSSKAAAAALEAQDSAAPDSPECSELPQADDSEPWVPEADELAHAEPSNLAQTATTEVQHAEHECVHQQQASRSASQRVSSHQDCLGLTATQSQIADATKACQTAQQLPEQEVLQNQQQQSHQQQQQQEAGEVSRAMSSAASGPLSKEPLCLRLRPLDGATKRLMQGFGCTALVEMPNNK